MRGRGTIKSKLSHLALGQGRQTQPAFQQKSGEDTAGRAHHRVGLRKENWSR